MIEQLGLDGWAPQILAMIAGLGLGLIFGALAQRSRFCLRRGLIGDDAERSAALGTWMTALAVAVTGTTALVGFGLLDFSGHRYFSNGLPLIAIVAGGVLFGAGMFLARGCASRLTVLAGSGNLRALTAILVFAVTAHATLKGVFAPARVWLASFELDLAGTTSLAHLPGEAVFWAAVLAIALLAFAIRSGAGFSQLLMGALIGALVPLGWLITGFVLLDEFEPITHESLAFTSAATETLFWWVAGTAVSPGFGVGLFGGVLAGSLVAALASHEFAVTGFTSDTPTSRYLIGGSLMGVGGVLAGGCTIGAGLSGVATLSISALLALASIIAGTLLTSAFARTVSGGSLGRSTSLSPA